LIVGTDLAPCRSCFRLLAERSIPFESGLITFSAAIGALIVKLPPNHPQAFRASSSSSPAPDSTRCTVRADRRCDARPARLFQEEGKTGPKDR
jgi:hypothetical protein